MTQNEAFGKEYFESGIKSAYYRYSWKPLLLEPRISSILSAVCPTNPKRILDYGCAKGNYVKLLRMMGYDAVGLDISSYAISEVDCEIKDHVHLWSRDQFRNLKNKEFDLILTKDVLEHLEEQELFFVLEQLKRIGKRIVCSVPVVDINRKYLNIDDEGDKTHVIRLTRREWLNLFGYSKEDASLCKELKGGKEKGSLTVVLG